MYDRRQVLLQLAAALGGTTALAGCSDAAEAEIASLIAPDGTLKFYTPEEYDFISRLSDALLPRTDTPGALDAGVPDYLDSMTNVWASGPTQEAHRGAIAAVGKALGRNFAARSPAERAEAVAELDQRAFSRRGQLSDQYRWLKALIVDVYYWSEPGATQELHYEPIPGRWDGDMPLAEVGKTWAT